ncbi:hypothetical protein [Brevibacterium atlanticum]|uniref:hypothetical protein n=1 Tax=Brevibacterium atlanticum TaxID=2697563 RepID=UPI00142354BE|nr:hypothetical protein [Brevibacterium atlanticum]
MVDLLLYEGAMQVVPLMLIVFFTSMFLLVGTVPISALTNAIAIAALSGSIGLLFGAIWRRFAIIPDECPVSSNSHRPKEDHHDRLA